MISRIQSIYQGELGYLNYSEFLEFEAPKESTPGLSLKMVFEGQEHYHLAGKTFSVNPGEVLIIRENETFETSIDLKAKTVGICIDLNPVLLESMQRDLFGEEPVQVLTRDFEAFKLYRSQNILTPFLTQLKRCYEYGANPALIEENMVQVSQLFLKLANEYFQQYQYIPVRKLSTKKELFYRLHESADYIQAYWNHDLKLSEIAQHAGISLYYFQRLFKGYYGLSPSQYQEKIRMEKARHLLERGQERITAIAQLCGYSDIQYFNKRFRRYYQVAPSYFRQSLKS